MTDSSFPIYSIIDGRQVTPCRDLDDMADRIVGRLQGRKITLVDSLLDIGDGRGELLPAISVLYRARDAAEGSIAASEVCLTGLGEQAISLRAAIEAAVRARRTGKAA